MRCHGYSVLLAARGLPHIPCDPFVTLAVFLSKIRFFPLNYPTDDLRIVERS